MLCYRLIGRLPVPCNPVEWGMWFATAERHVRLTDVGPLHISTVFLGIDHGFCGDHPLLFETMIFDDGEDSYQTRCQTWDEAEAMHETAVALAVTQVQKAERMLGDSIAGAVLRISQILEAKTSGRHD
jgi:hypothetical protein